MGDTAYSIAASCCRELMRNQSLYHVDNSLSAGHNGTVLDVEHGDKETDMSNTYANGAIITVRRPSGKVDEVLNTQHARDGVIPAATFSKMVDATRAAGQGDVLSQRPNIVEVSLASQRAAIVGRMQVRAGAFPGSRAWKEAQALEADLAAFDAAHPEVIAEIKAARAARTAAATARALRMED